jgi:hypothetical protein
MLLIKIIFSVLFFIYIIDGIEYIFNKLKRNNEKKEKTDP